MAEVGPLLAGETHRNSGHQPEEGECKPRQPPAPHTPVVVGRLRRRSRCRHVSSGSVTQVEIVGLSPDSDLRGRTTIFLKWQGTVLSRFAEVTVASRVSPGGPGNDGKITGDPATYLESLAPGYVRNNAPGFEVTYTELIGYSEWHGWRGPGWAATLGLAAWFGTFLLAGAGPEPWRATKWAWMWLTLLGGPFGCLAFLLLGGPLGLWPPKDLARRLTGVWAFLLAIFLLGGDNAS